MLRGYNINGELGNSSQASSAVPAKVLIQGGTFSGAAGIAAGTEFTCAIMADTTVQCWGLEYARDSSGAEPRRSAFLAFPAPVTGLSGALEVAGGGAGGGGHACAVLTTGAVQCWGRDDYYQLGNGVRTTNPTRTPVTVAGISDAVSVSAGSAPTAVPFSPMAPSSAGEPRSTANCRTDLG